MDIKKDRREVMPGIGLLVMVMIMIMVSATSLYAQQFYLRAGGGYSIQSGRTQFNDADPNGITGIQQSTDVTSNGSSATFKSLNGTVGEGFKLSLAAGYMFNPYVGAELGVNYFHGKEVLIGKLASPTLNSEEHTYLRGFDIAPAIVITPGFEKLNPYARLGALLTAGGHLTIETEVSGKQTPTSATTITTNAETEVQAKFSVGYIGALGLMCPIGDHLSVFGEVEFKSFTIESDEAEIKKYTTAAATDGQSVPVPGQQLNDLPASEKKFVFKETYTQGSTSDPDQPREVPKQQVNASGLGLNVGIRYAF